MHLPARSQRPHRRAGPGQLEQIEVDPIRACIHRRLGLRLVAAQHEEPARRRRAIGRQRARAELRRARRRRRPRPRRRREQRLGQRPARPVQRRQRQHRAIGQIDREIAQRERRLAEPPELVAQHLDRDRRRPRGLHRRIGGDLGEHPARARCLKCEAFPEPARHPHVDGHLVRRAIEIGLDGPRARRIARLPHPPARARLGHRPIGPEPDQHLDSRARALHLGARARHDPPHPPADLTLPGEPALDEQPIAARHLGGELHREVRLAAMRPHALEHPGEQAAVIAGAPLDQPLMIHSCEEARARAARERLQRRAARLLARRLPLAHRCLRGPSVERRRRAHVLRPLQAPLDLQRVDPEPSELGHQRAGLEVLGREQIRAVAEIAPHPVDDHLVGQPAGLRARAAVGAAPADRLAGQALPRVRHAERPVHEDLHLHVGLGADGGDVSQRQLTREDHAADAQLARELDRRCVGARHLRRRVHRQRRRDGARQPEDPEILHDDRVRAGRRRGPHRALHRAELVIEHQRVERHVPAHAVLVQIAHRRRELGHIEVVRPSAGVEPREPEVHRVGARAHRRAHRLRVTRGREDLHSLSGSAVVGARGHRRDRSPARAREHASRPIRASRHPCCSRRRRAERQLHPLAVPAMKHRAGIAGVPAGSGARCPCPSPVFDSHSPGGQSPSPAP